MNSRIYRFLDYIFRLVLLNFLIFITALSLSVFTEKTPNWLKDTLSYGQMGLLFFPSLVAVFDVIKQYEQNKSTSILRPFFQSLKKHYKSSLLMGIGMLIIAILLSNSINVFAAVSKRPHQCDRFLSNRIGYLGASFFPGSFTPCFVKFFGTAPDRLREAVGDLGFSRFRFDFDDACNRGFCSDYRYCVSVFFSFFRNQFADLSVGKTVT